MNAIVSGALRAAVLLEGQTAKWLDEESNSAVPCSRREVRRIMLGASDAIYFEGIDEPTTLAIVRRASALYGFLTRLSVALSAHTSDDDKRRALVDLETMLPLLDSVQVRDVAFAYPPEDVRTGLLIARESMLLRAVEFLEELSASEAAIRRVCEAWTVAAGDAPDADRARTWCVRGGFFRLLAEAVGKQDHLGTVETLFASRREHELRDVSVPMEVLTPIVERWLTDLGRGLRATVSEWQRRAQSRLNELRQAVPFSRASVQLVDGNERTLFCTYGFAESVRSREFLISLSEDRLMTRVVRSRGPVFLRRAAEDLDWTAKKETSDIVSWIGVPLLFHDHTIVGLLTIDFIVEVESIAPFLKAIQRFCEAVAGFLWLAGPLYRQHRAEQAMQAVKRIIGIIAAKHGSRELLQAISREVAINLECTHCTIFLPERRGNTWKLVATYPATTGIEFSLKTGLIGFVFDKGETLILSNASRHPAFVKGRNPMALTRSMLLTPIKAGDQQIGVICADQDAIGWFRSSDATFLEALAQQAGLAMQRTQAIDFLQSIAETILSLDTVKEILKTVLAKAIELVNATSGVIYLVDTSQNNFVVTSTVPHGEATTHPAPRVHGITSEVVRTREMISIADLSRDPRVHPDLPKRFKSLIAVPLKLIDKVIGVLFVDDEDVHEFTEVEKRLLAILASQSAIAIQKTDELNRSNELERQLVELNRTIPATQSLRAVLDTVGNGLCAILGPGVSPTINVYDEKSGKFIDCRSYGPLGNHLSSAPRPDGFGAYVVRTKQALYLEDVFRGPPQGPSLRDEHRTLGIKSLAAVPLLYGHIPLGVLFVNSRQPMEFTGPERRKIELYAAFASAAMSFAMANEKVQREFGTAKPGQSVTEELIVVTRSDK